MSLRIIPLAICFFVAITTANAKQIDGAKSNSHLKMVNVCDRDQCSPALVFDAHVYKPTPKEFMEKLKDIPAGTTILISGYGKDLDAGVQLGQLIRSKQLNTRVGRVGLANLEKTGFYKTGGVCLSACAMAFMGGVNRQIDSGDKFGVTAIEPNQNNLSENQIKKALLDTQNYLDQMGASKEFFAFIESLKDDKLHIIELDRSKKMGIVNFPKAP